MREDKRMRDAEGAPKRSSSHARAKDGVGSIQKALLAACLALLLIPAGAIVGAPAFAEDEQSGQPLTESATSAKGTDGMQESDAPEGVPSQEEERAEAEETLGVEFDEVADEDGAKVSTVDGDTSVEEAATFEDGLLDAITEEPLMTAGPEEAGAAEGDEACTFHNGGFWPVDDPYMIQGCGRPDTIPMKKGIALKENAEAVQAMEDFVARIQREHPSYIFVGWTEVPVEWLYSCDLLEHQHTLTPSSPLFDFDTIVEDDLALTGLWLTKTHSVHALAYYSETPGHAYGGHQGVNVAEGATIPQAYLDGVEDAYRIRYDFLKDAVFCGFYAGSQDPYAPIRLYEPLDLNSAITQDIDVYALFQKKGSVASTVGRDGITVSAALVGIDENAKVIVDTTSVTGSEPSYSILSDKIVQGSLVGVFSVILKVDGVPMHEGFGQLTVSFPVPNGEGRWVNVHHLHENGSITTDKVQVQGGFATVVVNDLSDFAIELLPDSLGGSNVGVGNGDPSNPSEEGASNGDGGADAGATVRSDAKRDALTVGSLAQTSDELPVVPLVLMCFALAVVGFISFRHVLCEK